MPEANQIPKKKFESKKNSTASKRRNEISLTAGKLTNRIAVIIFFLAFLLYLNTIHYQYAVDDNTYTYDNLYVQKGISSFIEIFSNGSQKSTTVKMFAFYRPIPILSFAFEKTLFGNNASINHFFNVLIYGFLCALLFLLLRRILNSYSVYFPLSITLLFVFHPIHTEVVANIKSRDELLCMLFGILTLISILKYDSNNKIGWIILSVMFFFLCSLSKETGLSFCLVVPLIFYFFTGASTKRIILITAPVVVSACVIILTRKIVLTSLDLGNMPTLMDNSLVAIGNASDRLATNFAMLGFALWLLIFPLNLSWDYSYNQFPAVSWSNFTAISSLVIYALLVFFSVKGLKRKSIFSFAILFYFFTYFITSNLFIKIGSSFAERFLFTPSLGFCITTTFFLAMALKVDLKKISWGLPWRIPLVLTIILILYAFKTIDRSKEWKNNITIYASGVRTAPNNARAHVEYASELVNSLTAMSDDTNERTRIGKIALSEYKKALEILPPNLKPSLIYFDMGAVYCDIGDTENGISMYQKSLQLNPNNAKSLNNYAIILFNKREYLAAADYFKKIAENNPDAEDPYLNLANCYYALNDFKSAIPYFETGLKLNPQNKNAIRELIYCYYSIGDTMRTNYYQAQLER